MPRRPIIQIDQAKCDGCGRCVPACAEGAIRVVDGKAKLVADIYCDGLGACLGECPRGAINIIEREADQFDQSVLPDRHSTATAQTGQPGFAGCPGAAMRDLRLNVLPTAGAVRQPSPGPSPNVGAPALSHWPIQLHLVPPHAPFLHNADLFLVADCVPFACADFHGRILRRRPVVIACPKLDDARAYVEKLADMLVRSNVKSLSVVHMEVPCCTNLVQIAGAAMRIAGSDIPLTEITISLGGEIQQIAGTSEPVGGVS
jgi:Pyruvate/2-oxoacid:ferredoxin oxidoreductase delta subunit